MLVRKQNILRRFRLLPPLILLMVGLSVFGCNSENDTHQSDSLVLFKPGNQYHYFLTGKDSLGQKLAPQKIILQMAGSPSQNVEDQNLDNTTPQESLPLAGHWRAEARPDTVAALVTTDEHAYSLGFPALSPSDFVTYTLPLKVDWEMERNTSRTQLITGLNKGTLHSVGTTYSVRRNLTYVGNEDLRLNKKLHSQCRKLVAEDESPVGQVQITYWVHPEAGFVRATYRLNNQERTYTLQQ